MLSNKKVKTKRHVFLVLMSFQGNMKYLKTSFQIRTFVERQFLNFVDNNFADFHNIKKIHEHKLW